MTVGGSGAAEPAAAAPVPAAAVVAALGASLAATSASAGCPSFSHSASSRFSCASSPSADGGFSGLDRSSRARASASAAGLGSAASVPSLASILRRDQRFRNGSSSFILGRSRLALALAQLGDRLLAELVLLGPVMLLALPLDERLLDVVLGHERLEQLDQRLRHGD